jgi:O-antigen/teichoic acid export membrane protein
MMTSPHAVSFAERAQAHLRPLSSWILRGGAAVSEQALFAIGNFVLNVALARSLAPADYGAFAFTTTLLLILTGVYNAFILEPATVIDPSRYESHLRQYWRAQLGLHVAFTIALGAVLAIAGLIVSGSASTTVGYALTAAGLSVPAIYLFWLARRFMYVLRRPVAAMTGSALYLASIAAGLVIGFRLNLLTPFAGFIIIALASLVAGVFMLACVARVVRLKSAIASPSDPPFTLRSLVVERWQYGRWLFATVCLETAVAPAIVFIATTMLGLAVVGTLRAMQMFVAPLGHGMTALSSLALPALARDFGSDRPAALRKKSQIMIALLMTLGLGIEVVFLLAHQPLEQLFYDGKYAAASILIPVFGLAALLEGLAASYTMVLSAVRRPQLLLLASAISAPIGLAISVVCIHVWGMHGAALAFALTPAVSTVVRRRLARPWLSTRGPTSRPTSRQSVTLDSMVKGGESRARP